MKKYTVSVLYRGQQIEKSVCAKNIKQASEMLELGQYFIKTYGYCSKVDNIFNGVLSSFDSGMLWEKEKLLIRVKIPFEELKLIIDKYKDEEYRGFNKKIGIK
jgi:hypothetical protein